jgi:hypothetical protein
MSLQVVDSDGDPVFELKYGTPATGRECQIAMSNPLFCEARGIDLSECERILMRRLPGTPWRFGSAATEEIILNWSR